MDIPVKITSNFGDTRLSSFHFGIDFGTNEQEGQQVFSVADGYVSRIKIEPGGYGRAVYIDHPNGTTSVYAHLKALNDELAQFVKNEQYSNKSFYVDLYLKPDQFKVKQKYLIGYSGNAGLSSGPHLHFELRDTKSQDPINCFLSCYSNLDTFKPVITRIWVYNENNLIIPEDKKSYDVDDNNNGDFKIKNNEIIEFPADAGLGIEAFDYITTNNRKLSFYSVKLFIDNILWFDIINDRIPFDEMSYVNSFVDYQKKYKESLNIVKQFVWPNQELMLYKTIRNQGMIRFNDTIVHSLKFVVADKSGNTSTLSFQGKKSSSFLMAENTNLADKSKIVSWSKKSVIDSNYIKITFPENTDQPSHFRRSSDAGFTRCANRRATISPAEVVPAGCTVPARPIASQVTGVLGEHPVSGAT
jgi:murein DD-endopeptidase MepM/ murein hydrolase activator NlpD